MPERELVQELNKLFNCTMHQPGCKHIPEANLLELVRAAEAVADEADRIDKLNPWDETGVFGNEEFEAFRPMMTEYRRLKEENRKELGGPDA